MKNALVVVLSALLSLGTALAQTISSQDELEIRALLEQTTRALESEDLPATLAAFDPASPLRPQAKQLGKAFFEAYDLRYELEDVQIGPATADGVEVRLTLTARRAGGAAFRPTRATAFGLVRKTPDGYKLHTGRIERREYLE